MPPIPESVAAAQPIIYILSMLLFGVIVVFLGILKWLMDRYVKSLDKIVETVVDQNKAQAELSRDTNSIVREIGAAILGKPAKTGRRF